MTLASILCFVGAAACVLLVIGALVRSAESSVRWIFLIGMLLLGAEAAFTGLGLNAVLPEEVLRWEHWRVRSMAFIPGTWLLFTLSYSRGNRIEFIRTWRLIVLGAYLVPLSLVFGFDQALFSDRISARGSGGEDWFLPLGWSGRTVYVLFLLGAVMILMNLERTFRAAIGVMRWRIKYVVLGLAICFCAKVYTSSQGVVYSGLNTSFHVVDAASLLLTCVLVGFGLIRAQLHEADVYPSRSVLQNSLTAVLAGGYLLIIGVLAQMAGALGGPGLFPLKAFLVLVGLAGLWILVFSDRVRYRIGLWISRHFHRPVYDYRKTWTAFTRRTTSMVDNDSLCRAVTELVSETFNLLSVTIWLVDQDRGRLVFGASTVLSPENAGPLVRNRADLTDLAAEAVRNPYPIDLEKAADSWRGVLKECDQDFFNKGGNRVCVPLVSGEQLQGILTVADRVSGYRFSTEDFDLLKCVGDQVAASLANIELSRGLVQAKEMEALQTMAAFFVHDLKNTASTLSLTLQNMKTHFQDPAFREDAMRGMTKSVGHLNGLISRLTDLRRTLDVCKVESDLDQIVAEVMSQMDGTSGLVLERELGALPKIMIDPEQIRGVVTNFLMNAKESMGKTGRIRVQTRQDNDWGVVSISDDGCGMSRDFMERSLFKPFNTTKSKGLGIGMFHCKTIVEAHRGRIDVESEEGKGTTFRVFLPLLESGGKQARE